MSKNKTIITINIFNNSYSSPFAGLFRFWRGIYLLFIYSLVYSYLFSKFRHGKRWKTEVSENPKLRKYFTQQYSMPKCEPTHITTTGCLVSN